eukprot:4613384-Pleurochrysis_carterae.AAC.1
MATIALFDLKKFRRVQPSASGLRVEVSDMRLHCAAVKPWCATYDRLYLMPWIRARFCWPRRWLGCALWPPALV